MDEAGNDNVEYAIIGYIDNDCTRMNAEIVKGGYASAAEAKKNAKKAMKEWKKSIIDEQTSIGLGDDYAPVCVLSRIVKIETIEQY